MLFSTFAQYLEKVESTTSRLEITEQLAVLYQQLKPTEIACVTYLLQGRLTPPYDPLEFQLSNKMVLRALTELTSSEVGQTFDLFGEKNQENTTNRVLKIFKELGDIGFVAEKIVGEFHAQHEKVIQYELSDQNTTLSVFNELRVIALESGQGSQERKISQLVKLLKSENSLSARYLVRIIVGKLRLGFGTMTIIDALSWAATGDKKWSEQLEVAWEKRADLGQLATVWLSKLSSIDLTQFDQSQIAIGKPNSVDGTTQMRLSQSDDDLLSTTKGQKNKLLIVDDEHFLQNVLNNYTVIVGVPVMPALCQRLNTAQEIIDKLGSVIAEPKYDGLRLQIHFWHDQTGQTRVRAFSRSLDDMTHMFPELLTLPTLLKCQSCILDCEAIGVDATTGQLRPFQETITRKRKHNITSQAIAIPMRFYLFDILELDEQVLTTKPLEIRKKTLQRLLEFPLGKSDMDEWNLGDFYLTPFIVTKHSKVLRDFHNQVLAQNLEGAVIKQAMSEYRSGRKGWRWVKIKESEGARGKLSDTLDVVVMGYYLGRGKRAQFGLGAILTGVITSEGVVLTIAKIGTGMTEAMLADLKAYGDSLSVSSKPLEYLFVDKSLEPDVWLSPSLVVEVAADEITNSPNHNSGYALRFPRLLKIRSDKTWEQATTLNELKSII